MIKHWRLYESISNSQIKQLYTAGISVNVDDKFTNVYLSSGPVPIVTSQEVWISTTSEKQETFLFLMFDTDKLQLAGKEYDSNHIWLDL